MENFKVEKVEVEYKEDLSNVPVGTVIVELPEDDFHERGAIRTEVVEEDYLLKVYDAIDKDKLAKDLVAFAWDRKDQVRHIIFAELNPQSLDTEFVVVEYGWDYTYPELHTTIMYVDIQDNNTFSKYSTKEEAVADYKNLITTYTYEESRESISILYDIIVPSSEY